MGLRHDIFGTPITRARSLPNHLYSEVTARETLREACMFLEDVCVNKSARKHEEESLEKRLGPSTPARGGTQRSFGSIDLRLNRAS